MRIHEIILESTDKNELLDFVKDLARAEKDAIEFLDDEGAEELDEDFKSKLKKAAAVGALGLAGLGASGAADAQSIGNSPFDYQKGNVMVVLAACSADMTTMSQIASSKGDQQKASYYNNMASKAKNLAAQQAKGDKGTLQYLNNIYNSHMSKNNKYVNAPNGWAERLQQGINSTLQKCINVINNDGAQAQQPTAKSQSQSVPPSEQVLKLQAQKKYLEDQVKQAENLMGKYSQMQQQHGDAASQKFEQIGEIRDQLNKQIDNINRQLRSAR